MKNPKFNRNCPQCGKILFYSRKSNLNASIKNKCKCKKCSLTGKNNPNYNKPKSDEVKLKIRNSKLGTILTEETKLKIGKSVSGIKNGMFGKTGKDNPRFGKPRPLEVREKIRLATIKYIEIQQRKKFIPNYNPTACLIFDEINKELGWNLQHAMNGGEIQIKGYFLDAYDVERNIVIEFDEVEHEKKVERDNLRQSDIIKYLNCQFFRINYNQSWREILR